MPQIKQDFHLLPVKKDEEFDEESKNEDHDEEEDDLEMILLEDIPDDDEDKPFKADDDVKAIESG